MNKIISFMMAVYMTVVSALGFAVEAPDLERGEMYTAEATAEQLELFRVRMCCFRGSGFLYLEV